jgi:uncharacterized protein YaeQ
MVENLLWIEIGSSKESRLKFTSYSQKNFIIYSHPMFTNMVNLSRNKSRKKVRNKMEIRKLNLKVLTDTLRDSLY